MPILRLIAAFSFAALLAAAGYLWRAELQALFGAQLTPVTVASLAAATVLALAVIALGRGLRRQQRDLREAKRIAALGMRRAPLTARPPPQRAEAAGTGPASPALLTLLGVIENADSRRRASSAAPQDEQPVQPSLAPQLYYQPIVALSGGTLVGYDVYRKLEARNALIHPRFVQRALAGDKAARAAFESHLVETALAASRQVFSEAASAAGDAFPEQAHMLHVHVTEALLDDRARWDKLAMLLSAHRGLSRQIVICIADGALARPRRERLEAIDRMLDADGGIGVAGLDFAPRELPDYVVRALQVAMFDFPALSDADTGAAARQLSCLDRLCAVGVTGCARDLAAEADIVDAIQVGATIGSGPVFAEPMRLRDEPRLAQPAQ
ncbi:MULTISPECIES: hypothetical protein [unclassified Roseitalea]|uniref:hypothetical protein n=1 Tax=unclassified Roseitalea TaxID=2639107 RepID=UPI00273EA058|nr:MULTISPECIES: hypothetical protein [unclassified Roseitalea]